MINFFKRHKKDIFVWGLVLLIFGLIFLIVYFENKDEKQMHHTISDINIVDDQINFNKNGATLNSTQLTFNDSVNVTYIQDSYWVVNEFDSNYYDVSMTYNTISFNIGDLVSLLNIYYSNDVPDILYFNFNASIENNLQGGLDDIVASTYYFDCNYGFESNDINTFIQYASTSRVLLSLSKNYFSEVDYLGFTFSVPFDFSYYKNYVNSRFLISMPLIDDLKYGVSSSDYIHDFWSFDYNNNENTLFIDDKSFSDNNYGVLYNNLSNQYAELQNQYNELNASYDQIQVNYDNVSNNYNNLSSQYSTLNSDYNSLNTQYNQLDSNYQSLLEQYNSLNNENYTFSELFWSLSAVPFGILSSGFNVNVLGVNLAAIISGLFTAVLLIWIIKKFLR